MFRLVNIRVNLVSLTILGISMRLRVSPTVVLATLSFVVSPFAHARWVTTDLGALDSVVSFNSRGTVAGNRSIYGPFGGYSSAATLVEPNGNRTTINGGLGTTLYSMSEDGAVVGQIEVRRGVLGGDPGARHAFIYQDGQLSDMGTLGGHSSRAVAVNASGLVAGSSLTSSGSEHAFVADAAGMRDLGTLGGSFSSAEAINDQGQIVGRSSDANGATYRFVSDGENMQVLGPSSYGWRTPGRIMAFTNNGLVVTEDGELFDITRPGDVVKTDATFRDANEAGQVVGHMAFAGEAGYRAVVYHNGVFANLGVLAGGMYSSALDVNERGQVVGFSHTGSGQYHSFLYTEGKMFDIAELVTGFTNIHTGSILLNDTGQVAGVGMVGNEYRAFLLTEEVAAGVSEPGTLAVAALGLALLAIRRSRAARKIRDRD